MKLTTPVLMIAILFPTTIIAQQGPNNLKSQQSDNIAPAQMIGLPIGSQPVSPEASLDLDAKVAFPQQSKAAQIPKQPSKPTQEIKRPTIEGSMVGYIDNAIVGSQIRMRFDAAFDNDSPDRAEFFYAKCGCYRNLGVAPSPTNQAVDPNAPGPGPGVPKSINFQQLYFHVEYAPVSRFSAFAVVPVRWIQPQGFLAVPPFPGFSNQAGLSDVQAGFKFAMLATANHYFTFQFRTYFPSGDSFKGLGTNHYSIEPSVLYYQKLTDRLSVEAQLGDWHPIGGSAGVPVSNSEGFAGDIFTYGIGPSYQLYKGERVRISPVVEMVGWRVLGGFQTLPGGPVLGAGSEVSGTNIVNIKAGVRTNIGSHNSFYIGFGQAVTHDLWYKHLVRLEYRYTF